ncbi:hypothetical protein FKN04_12310 [Bacillus glycinifermentans]|uniref:hypothetical protein n=1 Tax=Bacillus TaxID=1386 RepID=UPI001583C5BB|nr:MULTISPECIES: hypothetical protein [Bacillus]NUJ17363.1 hypothetical protein [Bacillus glycinifermentans]GIN66322.1 hypothetical protein J41TS2_17430 [Bacillus sonorensis]
MKKVVVAALVAVLLGSIFFPYASQAAENESASFTPIVVKTELQQIKELSNSSVMNPKMAVMDESGQVHIQAVPPMSKWKIVDHFRGNSKNLDTATELAARLTATLITLKYRFAVLFSNVVFPTFYHKKPTRYYSTTQYVADDKKYRYTILDMYIYKDKRYSKQIGYEYKAFRAGKRK